MMRVTTNGVLKGYKSSLMKSANNKNDAMKRVLTQRNFNSYAEDPAAATQAFRLRRGLSRAEDQISNSTTVISIFGSAWTSLSAVKESLTGEVSAVSDALKGSNDPTGEARAALAQSLNAKAESIVQDMNIKYSDSFIFSGADGRNVPFTWENEQLCYRGIPVDSGGVEKPDIPMADDGVTALFDANGTLTKAEADLTTDEKARVDAYREGLDAFQKDQENLAKLKELAGEANYVDLGLGLQEKGGSFITSSGFNFAISGVNVLGYGVDEDGDPKNVVSIIKKLADVFKSSEDGTFTTEQREDADRLLNKLQAASDSVSSKWTDLDGQSSYLRTNKIRLETYRDTVTEEILSIEQVDLADAITEFSWAQYCYNAALKVGNSILSQSLIDYMN